MISASRLVYAFVASEHGDDPPLRPSHAEGASQPIKRLRSNRRVSKRNLGCDPENIGCHSFAVPRARSLYAYTTTCTIIVHAYKIDRSFRREDLPPKFQNSGCVASRDVGHAPDQIFLHSTRAGARRMIVNHFRYIASF